jgi:hypothetical protein
MGINDSLKLPSELEESAVEGDSSRRPLLRKSIPVDEEMGSPFRNRLSTDAEYKN